MICAAHGWHTPTSLSDEWHHVIPRGWQRTFVPEGATFKKHRGYEPLWNTMGVLLCPTGHRNVHLILTRMMRGLPVTGGYKERKIAREAMTNFLAAGGNLDLLREAGQYGQ